MSEKLQVGGILMAAVVIIAALAMSPTIFQNIGTVTNTVTTTQTITFPAGTALNLVGQAVSSVSAVNATGGETITSGNWTVSNYVVENGVLVAKINNVTTRYAGSSVNITYTYEPLGYAKEGGTRAVVPLIAIFAALAVAVVALSVGFRKEIVDLIRGY